MELSIRMPTEMPVGQCPCGAVYACDVTGHNLGTAMVEALVVACNGDWDLAFDLLPDDDYLTKQLDYYDLETHLIVHGGAYEGRQINGVLFFIRPREDILEVTEEGTRRLMEKAKPIATQKPSAQKQRTFSKKEIESLIADYQMDALLDLASQDKRIIRDVQRLLYSVDPLISHRAGEMMGRVCAVIAQDDPGLVSRRLQGLLTAITDTAASSWGYINAVGEIIAHNPAQFAGYIPELFRLMGDRELLPEILEALCRIAEKEPKTILKKGYQFVPFLQSADPEIRGFTVILLGHLKTPDAKESLARLGEDNSVTRIYRNGEIKDHTIAQLATQALEKQ